MSTTEKRSEELTKTPAAHPSLDGAAARTQEAPIPAADRRPTPGHASGTWKPVRRIAILVVCAVVLLKGGAWIWHSMHTVSTDDAYINSYVTFVAPRVTGQVARVLVEDNNRVKKGDVLVVLDPEPYQVSVAIKEAALNSAKAAFVVADATVRSQIAQTRSLKFQLTRAIEDVNNQVALLRSRVASWEQAKASLVLAQTEFDRAKRLRETKVFSQEEFDQKREAFDVTQAQVKQALEGVYQARAALGLEAQPANEADLSAVPKDITQTFSSVRQALAALLESAAVLGVNPSSYDLTPQQIVDEFYRRDPEGNIDRIYASVLKDAPALKQAKAAVNQAEQDLSQAQLNLTYCTVRSEIDGAVTRRNVNPGNNVQVGQSLLAIRSLRDVWVDANFKETQLRDLRIGQHVDLTVDMYGGKRHFDGRISGFTMGTGSTLALLPAQNATGNFVKVVQRLPVRIDVLNYDPDKMPLFVGLSVAPEVDLSEKATGPNAGSYLQAPVEPAAAPPVPGPDSSPSPGAAGASSGATLPSNPATR